MVDPFTPPRRVAREAKQRHELAYYFLSKAWEESRLLQLSSATEYFILTPALQMFFAGDAEQAAAVPPFHFFGQCSRRRRCRGTWVCTIPRICCKCWLPSDGRNLNHLLKMTRSLEPERHAEEDFQREAAARVEAELHAAALEYFGDDDDAMGVEAVDEEGEAVEREQDEEELMMDLWGVSHMDEDHFFIDVLLNDEAHLQRAFEAAARVGDDPTEEEGDLEGMEAMMELEIEADLQGDLLADPELYQSSSEASQ